MMFDNLANGKLIINILTIVTFIKQYLELSTGGTCIWNRSKGQPCLIIYFLDVAITAQAAIRNIMIAFGINPSTLCQSIR